MTGFRIETAALSHHPGWARLRAALWPDDPVAAHLRELTVPDAGKVAFVALDPEGEVVGFVEAALRHDHVNGCDGSPVAFLEGLLVAPAWRRRGVARALAARVERWALATGCGELASDAPLDNRESHAMHVALGFAATERVVFFRKPLG